MEWGPAGKALGSLPDAGKMPGKRSSPSCPARAAGSSGPFRRLVSRAAAQDDSGLCVPSRVSPMLAPTRPPRSLPLHAPHRLRPRGLSTPNTLVSVSAQPELGSLGVNRCQPPDPAAEQSHTEGSAVGGGTRPGPLRPCQDVGLPPHLAGQPQRPGAEGRPRQRGGGCKGPRRERTWTGGRRLPAGMEGRSVEGSRC